MSIVSAAIFRRIGAVLAVAALAGYGVFSVYRSNGHDPLAPFRYDFAGDALIEETSDIEKSGHEYFWLNSGALFTVSEGTGKTVQRELPSWNEWRLHYAFTNAADTDDGYHPQNIFRLLTRGAWTNLRQEVYVNIRRYNASQSPNRGEWNGVHLFSRYRDDADLYYAGMRVDGDAVIKKKTAGVYYTLAQQSVFPGEEYNRVQNPNVLPLNRWVGLRSDTRTNEDGTVTVTMFLDRGRDGEWEEVLSATDDGKSYGGRVISGAGHAGIRTDFLDAEFDDYAVIVE